MRKNFKRLLAFFCAAALTTLSVAVAGNLSSLKTAAEVSPSGEINFGGDGAYLKLDNALESAPTSVEAEVKMPENLGKTEWTLRAGGNTDNIIGGMKVDNELIKVGATTADDEGPAEGSNYIEFKSDNTTLTAFTNGLNLDLSRYEKDELALAFWVYSETDYKLFESGSIRISNGNMGNDDEKMLSYQGAAIDVKTGWNYIELPLDEFTDNSGFSLDAPINSFRFHGCKNTNAVSVRTEKICEVKLVVRNKESNAWTLRAGGNTDNIIGGMQVTNGLIKVGATTADDEGPAEGSNYIEFKSDNTSLTAYTNGLNLDLSRYEKDELTLAFWVYSETDYKLFDIGSIRISNGNMGNDGEKMLSYQGSAINVKTGWNYIELPLDKFTDNSGFSLDAPINSFRFHGCKNTNAVSVRTEKICEVKLIANDTDKVFTFDYSGNESVYNNGYSVFSNSNNTAGDTPYALFVTREGKPALIYNDKMFVLNHNVCTGDFVRIGVTVNDNGTVTFKVGDNITATSKETATVPETAVFTATHSIGADANGGALMNGNIKNLVIKNGETVTGNWTLSANKAYPLNAVKDSAGTNDAHFAGIANSNSAVVIKYENATAGTAPENETNMDGYVFAGWFTDENCTTALTGTATAYAKYVDKAVLTVKAQVNSGKNAIRFVTTVDSLDYKLVGFDIEFCGKKADPEKTKTTTVYTSLNQYVNDNNEAALPTVFSPVSEYFAAFTVRNVPSDKTNEKFTVIAYWITLDGTTVYGESAQKFIS